jgi:glycosyltransferase involved in cell wall biosynthesis
MHENPLVSAVIIFLNTERFLAEAIESVRGQTYLHWELLLVDDGSSDGSTAIARGYAARFPDQIRYLEHPHHENRGMSAARNLGIHRAAGRYVAFLDADDVWLPRKLTEQVEILEAHPEAAMLYGNTEYWFDWSGSAEDASANFVPDLGVRPNMTYQPPALLPLFLMGKAAVPCTCSIIVRRDALLGVGGFEESFRGMYEDQAFYAKASLKLPIFVSSNCWDKYRQHPASACSTTEREGKAQASRVRFLDWLAHYLDTNEVNNPAVREAVQRAQWLNQHPRVAKMIRRGERLSRRWRSRVQRVI